ncbi:hypothetical protein BD410DRAFT_814297 [Rickenella mellea]|uniref:O-acyltransferase n=1 Tax=Rickenella mellea TaxID=50990 RepID=A0A4Y7Q7L0_9AGAM|nr:hypothetical protein BD410DRAFT_814297 [Rickenella mellea]
MVKAVDHPHSVPVQSNTPKVYTKNEKGGIDTPEGTLYVSKPFRSGTSKKLRAMIRFVPRTSHFDTTNVNSGANEFRGFFTLFWISMFLLVVQNYIRSFEVNGYPIKMAFAQMFSRDAKVLALSDAVLVLSTGLCVPFSKAIKNGWIRYYSTGMLIQFIFEISLLVTTIKWTFNRQWPWVQSGFLTLHTLVMIMKVHSYTSINGYLGQVYAQYERTLVVLRATTNKVGGWDKAVSDARARKALAGETSSGSSSPRMTPSLTPQLMPDGTTRSYIDGDVALALRNRFMSAPQKSEAESAGSAPASLSPNVDETGNKSVDENEPEAHALVDHPDDRVSALAKELVDMDSELTGTANTNGKRKVRWPDNITLANFADYQLIPTLVYELDYPRTERIRPLYLFEKTTAFFGTFALLYTITENFILPLTPTPDQSFWRSLLDLALPFMVAYLLLFYIIFECICNAFAELSRFADRQFYEDWVRFSCCLWNSTSWDEFARKWNKPVHTFLLRHVYAPTLAHYRFSRTSAMFATFFLSAVAHELVMAVVTKKIRFYLFTMQLVQIPLIAIGKIPAIKRNKLMGNIVFWVGLYSGFPLLCVAYCAY